MTYLEDNTWRGGLRQNCRSHLGDKQCFIASRDPSADPEKGFTCSISQHGRLRMRLWIQPGKNGTLFITGEITGNAASFAVLESLKRWVCGSSDENAIPTGIDLEPGDVFMLPTRGNDSGEVQFRGFARMGQSYVELSARRLRTNSVNGYETLIGWARPYTTSRQPSN